MAPGPEPLNEIQLTTAAEQQDWKTDVSHLTLKEI